MESTNMDVSDDVETKIEAIAPIPNSFYSSRPSVDVYSINNYTFGQTKAVVLDKDNNVADRMLRFEENWHKRGMRRSVEGVLLVHNHGHPHVLLLQVGGKFFKLPGGRLRVGEEEVTGLHRKLTSKLGSTEKGLGIEWSMGTLLACLWRPAFDDRLYPYLPPHVSQPKECQKVFLTPLPEKCVFDVPENLEFVAVPLFELYNNSERYGAVLSSIPQLLSRFRLNCI